MNRKSHRGFTQFELITALIFIGILIALLLPAIQAAREAARQMQCKNNLKQLSMGALSHMDAHRTLPSGGWGGRWVGDPNAGFGKQQPGGWLFNLLPYIEQYNLRDLGYNLSGDELAKALTIQTQTPLAIMNCPSRRSSTLLPVDPQTIDETAPFNANPVKNVARGDYAACSGDKFVPCKPGPKSYDAAEEYEFPTGCTGVIFARSEIRPSQIRDGLSKTILFGEKNVSPSNYNRFEVPGDNRSMYVGYDAGVNRWTSAGLIPDTRGKVNSHAFGSPHPRICNIAFCDGSVHKMNYAIDQKTFERMGSHSGE